MKAWLWFSIMGILAFQHAFSQSSTVGFRHISIKDGLVGDHILCIFQDSKGFIWIGTFAGLHRYDGYDFKVFNRDIPPYHHENFIADNTVFSIIEDHNHKLWIGTEKGLSRYDPALDSFTNYYPDPMHPERGPSHENIRCMYEDQQGMIWIGTYGGGINQFDPESGLFHHYTKGDGTNLPANRINTFYVDKTGRFWIGTEGQGLVQFNTQTEKFTYYKHEPDNIHSLSNDIVNTIIEDKYGKLWVATWGGGVCCFDIKKQSFKRYFYHSNATHQLKSSIVRSLLEDSRGRLWLTTFGGGLSLYDRKKDNFITYEADNNDPSGLSSNLLWTIFEDRSGILWIGTHGSGIDILNMSKEGFHHYEYSKDGKGLSSTKISELSELHNNEVWIGTMDSGINILNRSTANIRYFDLLQEKPFTTIRVIFEDADRHIWIGTDEGLYQYIPEKNRLKKYQHDSDNPASININGVYCIAQDNQKRIWAATWDSGLNCLEESEYRKNDEKEAVFRHYLHDPEDSTTISSNKIWTIYEDNNGDLWCGTERSLDYFDKSGDTFVHKGTMNVGRIIEDQAGIFWIGTYGQGVARFNPKDDRIKYFNQLTNIDINLVLDMVADEEDNLWIGSIDGITRFNTRNETFVNLDLTTELKKNEYEINVFKQLSDGSFAIGGDWGVDIFDPQKVKMQSAVPTVELTDFRIFNESVPVGLWKGQQVLDKTIAYSEDVHLTFRENLILIEFATLYYVSQDKHLYAYKLEGFDENWIYTDPDNRKAIYMNLDPGDYTFRVKGATREGVWSRERTLKLHIAPPVWKTVWFRLGFFILLIFGAITFYRMRIKLVRKKERWRHNTDKMYKEQEIIKLRNEKLDAELEHKKKELASSTLHNMHKNEELGHVRDEIKVVLARLKDDSEKKRLKKVVEAIDNSISNADNWESFEQNFNLLHGDFLKRLMATYPKLTHKDLKICAFIRMNFDNKEIARMLNITPESLGVSRSRIRKKMNLDKNIYLNDLIMRF